MKNVLTALIVTLALTCSVSLYGAVKADESLNTVLGKYVKNGIPDYGKLKKSGVGDLEKYLLKIASFDLSTLKTEQEKTAFWVNAYNAFAVKVVTENYPKNDEIFKIDGFFDLKKVNVGGQEMSLNGISSSALLFGKDTKDPRINFALFNGTKSSPKLRSKPFDAKNLNEELEKCTKEFIHNKHNVFLDKTNKVPDPSKLKGIKSEKNDNIKKEFTKLNLSSLFRWFEKDFNKHSGSVLKFVAKYMTKEDADYIKKNEKKILIDYAPYDWSFEGF